MPLSPETNLSLNPPHKTNHPPNPTKRTKSSHLNKSFLPVTSKRPVSSCFRKTTRWKETRCDVSPHVPALCNTATAAGPCPGLAAWLLWAPAQHPGAGAAGRLEKRPPHQPSYRHFPGHSFASYARSRLSTGCIVRGWAQAISAFFHLCLFYGIVRPPSRRPNSLYKLQARTR